MSVMESIYERIGMSELRYMACQDSDTHDEKATRVYVQRLCDMELERRLDMRHNRAGWHACSPGFGDGTGKSSVASDAMLIAYEQGIPQSPWHDHARIALSRLPERNLAALMVQTAKADHRTQGPFSATYDQIAASLGHYLQQLGWPAVAPLVPEVAVEWKENKDGKRERVETKNPAFPNGQAIKKAAHSAKVELIFQAKAGVI